MRKITMPNLGGRLIPFLIREIARPLRSARSSLPRLTTSSLSAKPGVAKRRRSDEPRDAQTRQRPRHSPELDMETLKRDFSPKRLTRRDLASISLWGAFWSAAFTVSVGVLGDAPALAALLVLAAFTSVVWYATGRRDRREEER